MLIQVDINSFVNNQDIQIPNGFLTLFLSSVNDIVVLGPEQFYATRDHYFTSHFLILLEMILDPHWTSVLFYSPKEVKVVAQGFSSANGITVSLDQKYAFYFLPFAPVILKSSQPEENHQVQVVSMCMEASGVPTVHTKCVILKGFCFLEFQVPSSRKRKYGPCPKFLYNQIQSFPTFFPKAG